MGCVRHYDSMRYNDYSKGLMNDHLNAINELFKSVGPLGDLSGIIKNVQNKPDLEKKTLITANNLPQNNKFAWFSGFCEKSQKLQQLFTTCLDDLDSIQSTCQAQREEFKRIQDKYNLLSRNISHLQDLVSSFERHYGHYRRYNVLTRILDDLDCQAPNFKPFFPEDYLKNIVNLQGVSSRTDVNDNDKEDGFIKENGEVEQGQISEFIDTAGKIGEELTKIIYSSQDSIDFFSLHPNYLQSHVYQSHYIDLRNRAFDFSLRLFREVYSKIEFNNTDDLVLDVSKHFLQYRISAIKLRPLLDVFVDKAKLGDVVYENHLDQLQLYYVAMRIKILHVIFGIHLREKEKKYQKFQVEMLKDSVEFSINLSNLEISSFSNTFGNSDFQRLKSIIYSISLSFSEYFKPHLDIINEINVLSSTIDTFDKDKIPETLINSDAFSPIYKCFETFGKFLKGKLSAILENDIKPSLDYKFNKNKFKIEEPFTPTVQIVKKIGLNLNYIETSFAIMKLGELVKLISDTSVNIIKNNAFDGHLFVVKNLHYIKDNLPISKIVNKIGLENMLEDSIFSLCLEFVDKHIQDSTKLLNKLQSGKVDKEDVKECSEKLKSSLETHLPKLYDLITNRLATNYEEKCPAMIMRINEVYFAVVIHISELQSMVQELLPEGLTVLNPIQINSIAKKYASFE